MTTTDRHLLRITVAISTATGVAYWVMKHLMRPRDEFSVLGHPWQPHMLVAHLLVGPAVVFALGLIAREHVLERVRKGGASAGRRSGFGVLWPAAPMILSGYVLQVVTQPSARWWLALAHLVSGILFALCFAAHVAAAALARRDSTRRGWPIAPTTS